MKFVVNRLQFLAELVLGHKRWQFSEGDPHMHIVRHGGHSHPTTGLQPTGEIK